MQHSAWPEQLLRDVDELLAVPSLHSTRAVVSPDGQASQRSLPPPLALRTSTLDPERPTRPPAATKPWCKPQSTPPSAQRSLILCFDGTGNKFQGSAADSNIIKIFSLLDRQDANQFHYYQPGIGTYVETSSLSQKSMVGKVKSAFLMRYYNPGDAIYFFGFSRGAYTARFLAQMLDYVGLLGAGNEEMLRFAWKTFARWQMRTEETSEARAAKREHFDFMANFRETFSRPVERIAFIGLFDCVNSVPQFESAWMRRAKFPYTANTSARVIRHAVSIDERRAKFRRDLISEQKPSDPSHAHRVRKRLTLSWHHRAVGGDVSEKILARPRTDMPPSLVEERYRPRRHKSQSRRVPDGEVRGGGDDEAMSATSHLLLDSATAARKRMAEDHRSKHDVKSARDEVSGEQDIREVWFAGQVADSSAAMRPADIRLCVGQHGDIGGGWSCSDGERPASDLPLIWMLDQAGKAGMPFDKDKLRASGYLVDAMSQAARTPILRRDREAYESRTLGTAPGTHVCNERDMAHLETRSRLHDSLSFGGGMSWAGALGWQVVEWLPLKRMDLRPDGSWRPINWPLPRGETRDMPDEALVHASVIRRMQADATYRPGNLIMGGGGRGLRKAPANAGIGRWHVAAESDRINQTAIRARPSSVHA
ncbi:hypothetical protein LTR53_016465 [Teratosphaeriaceae sp. CCFEE 6253]|nr:hypothetical protein LTR53_016465 [Teratosphaeriaceae sp. CCFEE 6253]